MKNPDIYIVGLGIINVDQITKETDYAFEISNEILYIENGIRVPEYLKGKASIVTDLVSLYEKDTDRMATYHNMAAKVIEAALDHPPVTFALYGHPTIFVYPPFLITNAAKHLNLTVKVLPGISAMDCIFAELMIDPGKYGIQMFEATDMLIRKIDLNPSVSTLLWQIGTLETALYSTSKSKPERFERFKKHLLKFYPEDHIVTAIYCSRYPFLPSEKISFKISDIQEHASQLHSGHTLYIPAIQSNNHLDMDIVRSMPDIDHLKKIAE